MLQSEDLKEEFAKVLKAFAAKIRDPKVDPLALLDEIVDDIYDSAEAHWYSSSRNC